MELYVADMPVNEGYVAYERVIDIHNKEYGVIKRV